MGLVGDMSVKENLLLKSTGGSPASAVAATACS